MKLWRMALRELRRSWRFAIFFIFNLSLGLTGFVSLEAFKDAIQKNIDLNAKAILSADIAVSSRRQITADEHLKIREVLGDAPESLSFEFFAMLSHGADSRLVSVKAVDSLYPFYGQLDLASGTKILSASDKAIMHSETAWVYPDLQAQMNLQPGNDFEVGQLHLKVADVIAKDGTQTFRAATLAPRIFINRDLLEKSGLIQYGSTYSVSYLYKLPASANIEKLKTQLLDVLTDPALQIETPKSAGEEAGRQLAYLSDYLGLVAIIALFMSVLGASYIYRLYMAQKLKEIAILRTLGMQSRNAIGLYVFQVIFLGILSSIPTGILTLAVLPLLSALLHQFTPFDLTPQLSPSVFLISLGMAIVGSFVVCFPFLWRIGDLRPAKLFSEERFTQDISVHRMWPFLPAVVIFWLLSVYQAHSWKVGSAFIGSLAVVLVLLALLAWGGLQLLARVPLSSSLNSKWNIKFSLLGLRRRRAASFAIFIAVGLGALLMNILPQLKTTLQAEFQVDAKSKLPSLFMFDIQDEQVQPLQDFLKLHNTSFSILSPLVRARILKVNDRDYERTHEGQKFQTREEERDSRFRNRGVNLSYRSELSSSETLLEGKLFSGVYDPQKQKYPELSVETKYADRVGLHLGDVLTFDVQGVEVQGQVVNLRGVKWASFQPNFFIVMQDGVLNDAPKTFIAAIPSLPAPQKAELQNALAKKFSNVSMLDVAQTVQNLLQTGSQMSWSLELMAALALLTGYIVLFSILRAQLRQRRWELNMLKVLGASRRELLAFILLESFVLTFLSTVAGVILSFAVSDALAFYVFEADFKYNLFWPVVSVISITFFSLLVAFAAGMDIIREKPLEILRNES